MTGRSCSSSLCGPRTHLQAAWFVRVRIAGPDEFPCTQPLPRHYEVSGMRTSTDGGGKRTDLLWSAEVTDYHEVPGGDLMVTHEAEPRMRKVVTI